MVNITPVASINKGAALTKAIKRAPISQLNNAIGHKPLPPAKPKFPQPKLSPKFPEPGHKPLPLAPKVNPEDAINKYLTNDTTYQSQIAALNKALGDYTANANQSETQYNDQYAQNAYDLGQEKTTSGIDQQNDFASRGFLRSGGYAVADSERLNKYASRQTSMDLGKQAFVQNNHSDLANFQSSNALAIQAARQDAINRRALGLLGG